MKNKRGSQNLGAVNINKKSLLVKALIFSIALVFFNIALNFIIHDNYFSLFGWIYVAIVTYIFGLITIKKENQSDIKYRFFASIFYLILIVLVNFIIGSCYFFCLTLIIPENLIFWLISSVIVFFFIPGFITKLRNKLK